MWDIVYRLKERGSYSTDLKREDLVLEFGISKHLLHGKVVMEVLSSVQFLMPLSG